MDNSHEMVAVSSPRPISASRGRMTFSHPEAGVMSPNPTVANVTSKTETASSSVASPDTRGGLPADERAAAGMLSGAVIRATVMCGQSTTAHPVTRSTSHTPRW
jgi:hypothetical protein